MNNYNKLIYGILISLCTVIIGYGVVSLLFEFLVSTGFMDEAEGLAYDKRNRTIWLISICCNIIGIQFFSKRKFTNIQRGIAIATVLSAAVWVLYYKDSLFFIED